MQEQPQTYFYWEAVPNNPQERLLSSVNTGLGAGKSLAAFGDLTTTGDLAGPCTIVIDQFEQLRRDNAEHEPIFEILHKVASEIPPPHQCTWVVAFRREYSAEWSDFEIDRDFNARKLSLKLFGTAQASDVMAKLAAEADFTMQQDLVDDMVRVATRDGKVSPVDIGIAMLVLQDLATRRNLKHVGLKDYRFAGGAQGLFTDYLRDNLDSVPEAEREGVLKALLALADLETDQRIASGKTLAELAGESGSAGASPERSSDLSELAGRPAGGAFERSGREPIPAAA